jgi:predicted RNase H-like HicB family nuclease
MQHEALPRSLRSDDNLRGETVMKQPKRETKMARPRREIVDRETALKRMKALPSRQKKLIASIKGTHVEGEQMNFIVELEQEEDGRWIAEVVEIPGAMAYGKTPEEAMARAEALALRVVADRLEHGEIVGDLVSVSFAAA